MENSSCCNKLMFKNNIGEDVCSSCGKKYKDGQIIGYVKANLPQYKPKNLIPGFKVAPFLIGKQLIAVPDKKQGTQLEVFFNNASMIIRNVGQHALLKSKPFEDKYNRGITYCLYYYEWLPGKEI